MRDAPPPIEALIPHRLPLRLVQRVLGRDGEGIVCEVRIDTGAGPLAGRAGVPSFIGIEAAAQAAACLEASLREAGLPAAAPAIGYLVSVRDAELHAPEIPAGRTLTARVQPAGSAPPLYLYASELWDGSELLLRAVVGTYRVAELS